MTLPVPVADKAVTLTAVDVFSKRLKAIGIEIFSVSTGATMTFKLAVPDAVDQQVIDAILRTPGVFEFVPWPEDGTQPAPGVLVPDGLEALFDTAGQITKAEVRTDAAGQRALDITFGAAGAEALATYTTQHVNRPLPIALDGIVLTAATILAPLTNGEILITRPTDTSLDPIGIPLEALAAILASGPLPIPWRHQQ